MKLLFPRLFPRRLARFLPRWVGFNVKPSQVFLPRAPPGAAADPNVLPWGFVTQSIVHAKVAPLRQALTQQPQKQKQKQEQEESEEERDVYQTALLGTHQSNPEVAELFAKLQADFEEGARQAYLAITTAFLARRDFTVCLCRYVTLNY
jgi:flagellar motor protein MotB